MTCRPSEFAQPATIEELAEVVRANTKNGRTIRVAGSGHSHSAIVATDGILISMGKIRGLREVDAESGEVSVWAGTTLRDLGPLLHEHGLAMANLGDTDAQTVSGAISTATHGTGITLGSLSSQVIGLDLITAAGETVACSETQNRETFKAAQVGLGCLGIISSVRLKLLPSYRLRRVKENRRLEDLLPELEELVHRNRHFEFWYFPHTNRVSTRASNFTDARPNVGAFRRFWENIVVDTAGLWVASEVGKRIRSLTVPISRLSARLNSEGESVDESYRMLAKPRYVRFTEMEYAVPFDKGPDCLLEVIELIKRKRIRVSFPIQYRYAGADDSYLSPVYERPSALIDVQQYHGMPYEDYFREAEGIFRRYGGRPHWGKVHYRTAEELRSLYPMWDKFMAVRRTLDPDGVFMNDYLRRVLGG